MDYQRQIKAFNCLAILLNNGFTMATLPIEKEKALAIMDMREEATELDLWLLEQPGLYSERCVPKMG